MKNNLIFFVFLFIPYLGYSQGFKNSAGLFATGVVTDDYIRLYGNYFGFQYKKHYSQGNLALGGGISVSSSQKNFNDDLSGVVTNQLFAQYLPSLSLNESLKVIFGLGIENDFLFWKTEEPTDIYLRLLGQLGLQLKPKNIPVMVYGTWDPTYLFGNYSDPFNLGWFRIGMSFTFGKNDDKVTEENNDYVPESPVDKKQEKVDESNNEIPWSINNSTDRNSGLFTIKDGGTLRDMDGNYYKTMLLGNKRWMAENLKVSQFNNGDPIIEIKGDMQWSLAGNPSWSRYENSVEYEKVVGKLYNGYVVTDERQICPLGWHIPSDEEWVELLNSLGGEKDAVPKLKSINGWTGTLKNNNLSGLKGLPGGARRQDGLFNGAGNFLIWWTATLSPDNTNLYCRFITNDRLAFVKNPVSLNNGFSIRCKED